MPWDQIRVFDERDQLETIPAAGIREDVEAEAPLHQFRREIATQVYAPHGLPFQRRNGTSSSDVPGGQALLPKPGGYRLWTQLRRGDVVSTVRFTVTATSPTTR